MIKTPKKVLFAEAKASNLKCKKGELHNTQCISLVCVEPNCRSDSLACCICFATSHKVKQELKENHEVIPLTKLIQEYEARKENSKTAVILSQFIEKEQKLILEEFVTFRIKLNDKLDAFEEFLKNCISENLKEEISEIKDRSFKTSYSCLDDLEGVVDKIMKTSYINNQRVMGLTRQNELAIRACIDKISNSTAYCTRNILTATSLLQEIQTIFQTTASKIALPMTKNVFSSKLNDEDLTEVNTLEKIPLEFGINHHEQLKVSRISVCSDVSALIPQYALLTPHLDALPVKVTEWTIKIKKCRDFTTRNTLAIGVLSEEDAKISNYEGECNNMILVTSQGYVEGTVHKKCGFVYREGDTINCKYDPFYNTFEMSKTNGRKVVFNTKELRKPLCACVRLTYSSDCVEIA